MPSEIIIEQSADGLTIETPTEQIVLGAPSVVQNVTVTGVAILTSADVGGYTGGPNDSGAPVELTGAALGTQYLEGNTGYVWQQIAEQPSPQWEVISYGTRYEPGAIEIYVDVAGDDDASGTAGDPILTLREAARRAPSKELVRINLGAGTFPTTDLSAGEERLIFRGDKIYIKGTNAVSASFTFDSIVDNVITAQGAPGWTIDEHAGKWLRWFVFGPSYPDYYYGWRIESNTADTLTVKATFTGAGLGGGIPPPTPGTALDIATIETKITRPATGDSFASRLYYDGRVLFQDIVFDGSALSMQVGVQGWTPGSDGQFFWCEFLDQTNTGVSSPGALVVLGCYFRNNGTAVSSTGSLVANGDNFFDGCAICFSGVSGSINHGNYYAWHKDCALIFGGSAGDGSLGYWLDNCDQLVLLGTGQRYEKTATALGGFDATKRTLNTRVFGITGVDATINLFDSSSVTLLPDATFFLIDGTTVALSDYLTDGANLADGKGNRVIG